MTGVLGAGIAAYVFANSTSAYCNAEEQQSQEQIVEDNKQAEEKIQEQASSLEQEQVVVQQQNEDIPAQPSGPESVIKELTNENLLEVLNSQSPRLIIFYRSSNSQSFVNQQQEEFSEKMIQGLKVTPYKMDLDKCQDAYLDFLKQRDSATLSYHQKHLLEANDSIALVNKFDDIWYWSNDFLNFFYGDLFEQTVNFFVGLQTLRSADHLILNQFCDNDVHMVIYGDNKDVKELNKKTKQFRKMHISNTIKALRIHFWLVTDPELAKQLKISTDKEHEGDAYLIKRSGVNNYFKKNINLCGYDFHSEKVIKAEDLLKDADNSFAKVLMDALSAPILINDLMSFISIRQKFKSCMLIVYCDKEKHPKLYKELYRNLVLARKALPLNMKPNKDGSVDKSQRQTDVVFMLSTVKNMMDVQILEDKPQAIFVTPDEHPNFIDLLSNYLPKVEKIEGLPKEEYLKKCFELHTQKEEEIPGEDDVAKNKKETHKLIYNPDRFIMNKSYRTTDKKQMTNLEEFVKFVKGCINGEEKLYWESDPSQSKRFSEKLVGEDFDTRVLKNKSRDALVLITHPIKEKNRNIKGKFEAFIEYQKEIGDQALHEPILFARYNGVNESKMMRSPQKLPQILFFRAKPEGADQNDDNIFGEKEVIAYEKMDELLVQQSHLKAASKINEFLEKNRKDKKVDHLNLTKEEISNQPCMGAALYIQSWWRVRELNEPRKGLGQVDGPQFATADCFAFSNDWNKFLTRLGTNRHANLTSRANRVDSVNGPSSRGHEISVFESYSVDRDYSQVGTAIYNSISHTNAQNVKSSRGQKETLDSLQVQVMASRNLGEPRQVFSQQLEKRRRGFSERQNDASRISENLKSTRNHAQRRPVESLSSEKKGPIGSKVGQTPQNEIKKQKPEVQKLKVWTNYCKTEEKKYFRDSQQLQRDEKTIAQAALAPVFVNRIPNRLLNQSSEVSKPRPSVSHQRIKAYLLSVKQMQLTLKQEQLQQQTSTKKTTKGCLDSLLSEEQKDLIVLSQGQPLSKDVSMFDSIKAAFYQKHELNKQTKAVLVIQRQWRLCISRRRLKAQQVLTLADLTARVDKIQEKINQRLLKSVLEDHMDLRKALSQRQLQKIVLLQKSIRKFLALKRLKRKIDSRDRVAKLVSRIQRCFDDHLQSSFFYQYEKLYEKAIRNTKAQKIIDSQNIMQLLNETRNVDVKMKILRARAKSFEVILTHQQREAVARGEQEEPDEDDQDQMRLHELKKLLKIQTKFQLQLAKSRYALRPDLIPSNNFKLFRRRGSHPMTKIDKFKKASEEFTTVRYYKPRTDKEKLKNPFRKVILQKQRVILMEEYQQLLSKEIHTFKKEVSIKLQKKKKRRSVSQSRSSNANSSARLLRRSNSPAPSSPGLNRDRKGLGLGLNMNSNQTTLNVIPVQQERATPTRRHQSHNTQLIPSGFRKAYYREQNRVSSQIVEENYSPLSRNMPEGLQETDRERKQKGPIPQSFLVKEGAHKRFHTLIPRPYALKAEITDYDQSLNQTVSQGLGKSLSKYESISESGDPDRFYLQPEEEDEESLLSKSELPHRRYRCLDCQIRREFSFIRDPLSVHNHDPWAELSQRIQKYRKRMKKSQRRVILHGINTKDELKGQIRDDEWLTTQKIKEVRRRQFFNFFADFYDKYEQGAFGLNQTFTFTDEEKERNLKKYFKQYYNEDLLLPTKIVELPLTCDIAAKKRLCNCYQKILNAQEDEKEQSKIFKGQGEEDDILKSLEPIGRKIKTERNRRPKTIKVKMLVGREEVERKEEYLGMSQGIQNSYAQDEQMSDMDQILGDRIQGPKPLYTNARARTQSKGRRFQIGKTLDFQTQPEASPSQLPRRSTIIPEQLKERLTGRMHRLSLTLNFKGRELAMLNQRKNQNLKDPVTESLKEAYPPDLQQILAKYSERVTFHPEPSALPQDWNRLMTLKERNKNIKANFGRDTYSSSGGLSDFKLAKGHSNHSNSKDAVSNLFSRKTSIRGIYNTTLGPQYLNESEQIKR